MVIQNIFDPKKLGSKILFEIWSDIADMDKCHQEKCCMDYSLWPQKPTFKVSKLGN